MQNEAKALADARTKFQELYSAHSESWAKWADENDALIRSLTVAKEEMQRAEATLRAAGLAHYAAHPESKKLPFGLGVRVTQSLVYDANTALSWCKSFFPAGVTLDKKEFEKAAKVKPLAFVTVEEVPTITVPTDTAKLLAD